MKAVIYTSPSAEVALKTDHAASSYGIPVLVLGGKAYGPHDMLPGTGLLGGEVVRRYLAGCPPLDGAGAWVRTPEGEKLAQSFLLAGVDEIGNRTGTP